MLAPREQRRACPKITDQSSFCMRFRRFLGGDGAEDMAVYRVSGHLYTVSFDSNLGDVMVRSARRRYTRSAWTRTIDAHVQSRSLLVLDKTRAQNNRSVCHINLDDESL